MNHRIRRFISTLSPVESMSAINSKVKDMVLKGLHDRTLAFYREELHFLGLHGNPTILPSVIKASSVSSQNHQFGLQLHCIALKSGADSDPVVSNALISMYAKASQLHFVRKVFDEMPERDNISWGCIVNCHIQNGYSTKGLKMFKEMLKCGFVPRPEMIASVISVCGRLGYVRLGRVIHAVVIVDERIEGESVFLSTSFVDFYLKCGDLLMAFRIFNQMEVKNEVSWTAMISGCTANLEYDMAIDCFRAMQVNRVKPNRVTLIAMLPVCAEFGCIKHGKEIHGYAFRHGFEMDHQFSTSLIDMYCKSGGALRPARLIFERLEVKDVVMWSSIIGGYSRREDSVETIKLFSQMRGDGIEPSNVTLLAVIATCTSLVSLEHGRGVHGYIVKCGLNTDVFIGNALINMYSKCGCLSGSQQIFREMLIKDLFSWSTLINGYGLHGYGEEALSLFHEMQETGVEPEAVTLLVVLSACNHAGLVEEAQKILDSAKRDGIIPLTQEHYNCQVNILGKSGKIEDAFDIVRTMPMKPSAKIWRSLVSACKVHERLELAEMIAHQLIRSEPRNGSNYTLLSMIYAEAGNWSGVEEVWRIMRVQGLDKCYGISQIAAEN